MNLRLNPRTPFVTLPEAERGESLNQVWAGLGLVTVLLLGACTPAAPPKAVPLAPIDGPAQTATPPPPVPTGSVEPAFTPIVTHLAVATSRGPNLEATDPTTVSLASGGVQLVEFFRFT
jgi:hypothetical protein